MGCKANESHSGRPGPEYAHTGCPLCVYLKRKVWRKLIALNLLLRAGALQAPRAAEAEAQPAGAQLQPLKPVPSSVFLRAG